MPGTFKDLTSEDIQDYLTHAELIKGGNNKSGSISATTAAAAASSTTISSNNNVETSKRITGKLQQISKLLVGGEHGSAIAGRTGGMYSCIFVCYDNLRLSLLIYLNSRT